MQQQTLKPGATKSWLANSVIQKNLRLTIPNGDTRDYEATSELTDDDVCEVVSICDSVFRSLDK
ncbi:hypothetical protein GALL_144380 [mine drainage metagenome]|uniref:Uncharacterized protein n=1 Tax=mine drainage metagenome TaxID=410659 RepID=A0A1J5S6M6_9ZZZZ